MHAYPIDFILVLHLINIKLLNVSEPTSTVKSFHCVCFKPMPPSITLATPNEETVPLRHFLQLLSDTMEQMRSIISEEHFEIIALNLSGSCWTGIYQP